jgi:deazaflavin-dependent oxidoreductase (nitroreductase family)
VVDGGHRYGALMQRWIALFSHYAARTGPVGRAWGRIHAGTLRRTRGRIGAKWLGAPVLVLATIGRKSGKVRQTPLLYVADDDRIVLLAANAGNDRTPAWWLNLRAAETVEILIGGRRRRMVWREATGEEYDRLFAEFVKIYPPSEHYVGFTGRRLPVVVLEDV